MENLRALPLTCVRVRLSTAGADVCDIMESLSIPELFLQEKSLSSISASGKIFHRHAAKRIQHAESEPRQHKGQYSIQYYGIPSVKGTNGLPAKTRAHKIQPAVTVATIKNPIKRA